MVLSALKHMVVKNWPNGENGLSTDGWNCSEHVKRNCMGNLTQSNF